MADLLILPGRNTARPINLEIGEGLAFIGFEIRRLSAGQTLSPPADARNETCLVAISGTAELSLSGTAPEPFGARPTPFAGLPHAAYLPPGGKWRLRAETTVEIAICKAPASIGGGTCQRIGPERLAVETRGRSTNTRYVTNILCEGDGVAETLFVIELRTPGGHSSSYPPHKHDTENLPSETALEETYYSRFDPPQGFAFQRIYTDDRSIDEALVLRDGTLSLVPRGYHPCAVCHGYEMYQLCVMAGPRRLWRFTNDPDHDWLVDA